MGLLFIGVFSGEGIYNSIVKKDTGQTLDPDETVLIAEGGNAGSRPDEVVKNIEFYLDGQKGSGIFLGETLADIQREDVLNTYGEYFSNAGFEFTLELKNHNLKPGIHTLFIYAVTDKGTEKYILKKLIIRGEEDSSSIKVEIDDPENYSAISSGETRIQGWAIDTDSSENTGIDKVEIYLDGTMENGLFLGDANYGTLTRGDIADSFGPQFAESGYYLDWETSSYTDDISHFIFVYAHSTSGEWNHTISEIYFTDGKSTDKNFIIETDNDPSSFEVEPEADLDISGWAIFSEPVPGIGDKTKSGTPGKYPNMKVVFASDMDGGDYDLFIINLDGTQLLQLTDSDVDELYPDVSPDGSEIAYTSIVEGYQQIMAIKVDGTGLRQITDSGTNNTYPSWSNDGKYIFFESKSDEYYGIYRVNADGSDSKKLSFNPEYDILHPASSFDKPLVFFESVKDDNENILSMDLEGSNIQSVILDEERNITPDASSNADILAFVSFRTGNSEIYFSTLTGDNITQVTSLGGINANPSLSPDGKYIGFDSNIKGNLRIYIYSFEKEELIDLTDDENNNYIDPCFLFY